MSTEHFNEPEWMRKARQVPLRSTPESRAQLSRPRPNNSGSTAPQKEQHAR